MKTQTVQRVQSSFAQVALTLDELVSAAVAKGIDGLCLTEHDRAWDPAELAAARLRSPIPLLSAVELTTDMGHVLAFGLPDSRSFSAIARAVFERAQRCGALLFLAHPARDGLLKVSHETVEYFESVESQNGSDSKLQNLAAAGLARGFLLPGIGGSRRAHGRRGWPRGHPLHRGNPERRGTAGRASGGSLRSRAASRSRG